MVEWTPLIQDTKHHTDLWFPHGLIIWCVSGVTLSVIKALIVHVSTMLRNLAFEFLKHFVGVNSTLASRLKGILYW